MLKNNAPDEKKFTDISTENKHKFPDIFIVRKNWERWIFKKICKCEHIC